MTDTSWLEDVSSDTASRTAIPKEEQLSALAKLAEEQLALEALIKELEETLSERKKTHRLLSEGKLPELLRELGVSSFRLANGLEVKSKQFVDARIVDPEAYNWLEANGNAELVKMEVKYTIRRTDKERLQPLMDMASKMNVDIAMKESVHAMTLKAFVSDAIRNGLTLDHTLFDVYVGHRVTIK